MSVFGASGVVTGEVVAGRGTHDPVTMPGSSDASGAKWGVHAASSISGVCERHTGHVGSSAPVAGRPDDAEGRMGVILMHPHQHLAPEGTPSLAANEPPIYTSAPGHPSLPTVRTHATSPGAGTSTTTSNSPPFTNPLHISTPGRGFGTCEGGSAGGGGFRAVPRRTASRANVLGSVASVGEEWLTRMGGAIRERSTNLFARRRQLSSGLSGTAAGGEASSRGRGGGQQQPTGRAMGAVTGHMHHAQGRREAGVCTGLQACTH